MTHYLIVVSRPGKLRCALSVSGNLWAPVPRVSEKLPPVADSQPPTPEIRNQRRGPVSDVRTNKVIDFKPGQCDSQWRSLRTPILVARSESNCWWELDNAPVIREQKICAAECEARSGPCEAGEAEAGRGQHPASGEAHQARAPLSRETPGRNGPVHSASGEISLFLQLIYYFLFWVPRLPEQFECVFTSCCMQPVRQWGIHLCWTWQTLWHD